MKARLRNGENRRGSRFDDSFHMMYALFVPCLIAGTRIVHLERYFQLQLFMAFIVFPMELSQLRYVLAVAETGNLQGRPSNRTYLNHL